MAIGDDFSVAANGDIRHESGTTTYTVLEFHRWLQDLADDASASGDDLVDITSSTPSERSTDNIITLLGAYNIDDDAAEYLYNGSISQNSGKTVYSGLIVVGSLASTTTLKIVQANAFYDSQSSPFWGTGLNEDAANNILLRILVKTRDDGVDIDGKRIRVQARTYGDTYAEFSVTMGLGNATAAIFTNTDLNNQTASGTVAGWTINNTEGYQGIDVDNDSTDEYYYSKWDRVTSPDAINDVYEWAKYITRAGTSSNIHSMNGELFRGITHQFDYDNEQGTPSISTNDMLVWGEAIAYDNESNGPFVVGEVIEETSATPLWRARILMLDDDGTTGTLIVMMESGTVSDNDSFTTVRGASETTADAVGTPTAVSGGGVLHVLAHDSTGDTLWMQLLIGTAPADNAVMYFGSTDLSAGDATDMIDVDGTPTARSISPCFLGQSTGSSIIGAFGIGVEPTDLSTADILFDLTNTQKSPPNYQTFTVGGLVSTEDRVLVGPKDTGNDFEFDQLTTSGVHTNASTTVTVTASIPSDTPSTGTIRIQDSNGIYQRMTYTGWTGTTFTGCTGSGSWSSSDASNLFISYIDDLADATSENYTAVYSSDRSLWVRVRDGGSSPIKTFETAATFGSGGGSVTAIRTSDE